ncbi:Crp/Fnr family transcriptional regulator [Actinomadura parmotrematis]|uniref:Cyclic nucleotide-binding domain-containing protein n=1 Tax=Actinomadura parmotrematis TaxID=2864039 RepID=A0ABS7G057_9ACTN|nr:cyclic nucleotide-binding domain-containing protein [Actinomadura parmotrematis]MBW8485891.1 cyclic nucleotide-binding domain-containing protein [Actinomadura parmotrematis]
MTGGTRGGVVAGGTARGVLGAPAVRSGRPAAAPVVPPQRTAASVPPPAPPPQTLVPPPGPPPGALAVPQPAQPAPQTSRPVPQTSRPTHPVPSERRFRARAVGVRRVEQGVSQSFWDSLTDVERVEFAAEAECFSVRSGHVLWREGDVADHVLVIRSGYVKVCLERDGWERIIAMRGPGHLVGERATLLLRLRSADIVALGDVTFLRMSTPAFAAFLSAFPRLLAVLERQLYDRLTENAGDGGYASERRDGEGFGEGPGGVRYMPGTYLAPAPAELAPPPAPAPVRASRAGQICSVLFTDIVKFSSPHRTDDDRLAIRSVMYRLLLDALDASDVPRSTCHQEDRGDGTLTVVPPGTPPRALVDPMLARLAAGLAEHNRHAPAGRRIQLRVALQIGPVTPDEQGVSGLAIIQAARLLDAGPFKKRMGRTGAGLGFITTDYVFQNVVAQHTAPGGYKKLTVKVKETELKGWMTLFPA